MIRKKTLAQNKFGLYGNRTLKPILTSIYEL